MNWYYVSIPASLIFATNPCRGFDSPGLHHHRHSFEQACTLGFEIGFHVLHSETISNPNAKAMVKLPSPDKASL